jgi:hypothetical protein
MPCPPLPILFALPAACQRSRRPSTTAPTLSTSGFKNDTNARNFAGLNFDQKTHGRWHPLRPRQGLRGARWRSIPIRRPGAPPTGRAAVDAAADARVSTHYPRRCRAARLRQHNASRFSVCISRCRGRRPVTRRSTSVPPRVRHVRRAVLPRVLTLAQVEKVIKNTPVEIEVFGFGSLCVMNEGRCWLSSYACGESPNTVGACSPAKYVKWEKKPGAWKPDSTGILIDRFADDESAGYPTLCKGRFEVAGRDLLCARRADFSLNVHGDPAGDSCKHRCTRHQGRGTAAQPDLCRRRLHARCAPRMEMPPT